MKLKTKLGKGDISHARRDAFIAKAQNVHGDTYSYSNVVICVGDDNPKVAITCRLHGDFQQRIGSHLVGCGCRICGNDSRYGDGKRHRRVTCKYCGKLRRMRERWISGLVCSDCSHHHKLTAGNTIGLTNWEVLSRRLAKLAVRSITCRRTVDPWYLWANNKQSTVTLRNCARNKTQIRPVDSWHDSVKRMTHTWRRKQYVSESEWTRWSIKKRGSMKTAEKISEKRKVTVTAREIHELVIRQNFECAITGQKLDVNDATIDHIVPISIGGGNEISNLQVVTKAANRIKGNLTMEQLVDLCQRIVNKHGNSVGFANDRASRKTTMEL